MRRALLSLLATSVFTFALAAPSFAQATRTWISGVGDDANPCSRTAPCKTFAGAISKTAAGGEISVLDPGGFGGVTITKAITLDGRGQLGSILVSGTSGVNVNAGINDTVILRNLSINGIGNGVHGILFNSGAQLVVENVTISGFVQSGIMVTVSGTSALAVRNTTITQGLSGVKLKTGTVSASLDNVSIREASVGVTAVVGSIDISNSTIAQSSAFGVLTQGGIIDIDGSMLSGNAVAALASSGTIRISNSNVYNNATGFGCGAGTLASNNNNRNDSNGGGGCAPNATITLQ
jgi:hypothetical protein